MVCSFWRATEHSFAITIIVAVSPLKLVRLQGDAVSGAALPPGGARWQVLQGLLLNSSKLSTVWFVCIFC